jgi:hypothetical protein
MVLPDMPAVAAISVEIGNRHTGGEGPPRLRATLDLRDLVTGSQLASTQLQDELYDPNERAIQGMDQYALMSATPKQLVVVILDRLHRVDTTPFAKLELPMPLLLTEKEVPSVVGDKPATLTWEVVGGKPPMRYELANPVPGVTLVDGSPAVRIDPAAFAQLAPEQLWRSLMNHHNGGNTATERLQKYAQREQTRIKDLLGLELKQIPAAMWINLRVTDAENQTYTASRLVLIDLPQSAFDQQIAAMQRQMEQAQAGRQPVANPNVGDDAALRQRIADLERENARLQGQVQVLTELLQNARPATQPAR